jgi:hypothetical protein
MMIPKLTLHIKVLWYSPITWKAYMILLYCNSAWLDIGPTGRPYNTFTNLNKYSFWMRPHNAKQFLGACAKFRKATISFVISVRSHGKTQPLLNGFPWNMIFWVLFETLSTKFKFHYKNNGHFTVSIISRSILLRMRNVAGESCRENQNTFRVQ